MSMIGRALAKLSSSVRGQLMLELPDDLQPAFVANLLAGANAEVPATPAFCLLVHGKRKDFASVKPSVDFRELAMYRQGSHLAVAFASENRGMSTYSSVYPLLLSNGFPSSDTAHGGTGVGGLREFSTNLAEVLAEHVGTYGLTPSEFRNSVHAVLRFLADSYEFVGNGQSSFAADWWLHVQQWTESLALVAGRTDGPDGTAAIYGCAGLPVPALGPALDMAPKEYVGILRARWHSPSSIATEVARLQGIDSASRAASFLIKLDWDDSLSRVRLRSDSPVAYIALSTSTERLDKIWGWASLKEEDFANSFVDAKGKLSLRRLDAEFPSPWKHALPLIVARTQECSDERTRSIALEEIELVIPYKEDVDRTSVSSDASQAMANVDVHGTRGCSVSFDAATAQFQADGLHLRGKLTVTSAKKAPNLAWIEAISTGVTALYVADKCDGSFTILRPDEVAVWSKPQGRASKSSLRGPEIWSRKADCPANMELPWHRQLRIRHCLGK